MIEKKVGTEFLTEGELEKIHSTSMEIIEQKGVVLHNDKARKVFANSGAKVDGETVYIPRELVDETVARVPRKFILHARNPNNNVVIGGNYSVLAPGYGAPWILDFEGGKRSPTYEDYINFTKLAGASDYLDVLGGVLVEPNDLPEASRHARMFYAGANYSDKPLMGSALGEKKAQEVIKMASILHGSDKTIDDRPIVISVINTTSPLKYDDRMLQALMTHARYNQPVIIASLIMAGSTGPVTVAGALTLQNVEVLTGIVLSQLVSPGTPVVYGSASTIVDMATGDLAVGSPEYAKFVGATAQLGRFYGIPCRGGGAITDSLIVDGQAGYESMMSFIFSIVSGMDFVLHSAGLLKNYMAMSYEKFVLDEEILDMVGRFQQGLEVNEETIAKSTIQNVGHGGHYLKQPHTIDHLKEFRVPNLSYRKGFESEGASESTLERAHQLYKQKLERYESPPLDSRIEKKLQDFMGGLD